MRKTTVRHLLHGILDLLPVILIPVFMVYSHRHTIDNYQVEYVKNEIVDFNQLVFGIDSPVTENGITISYDDDGLYIVVSDDATGFNQVIIGRYDNTKNDYYLVKDNSANLQIYLSGQNYNNDSEYIIGTTYSQYNQIYLYVDSNIPSGTYYIKPQVFNLTQMFGSGNEPTIQEFNQYFPNDYYDYTLSRKELLNVGSIVYDDTDIGSQFLYCLYNSVDKYFNFNNVFNFNQIYDWLVLNIFNGNAPLIVPVVWNIILYEFIMDLMFLLYGLFMFFIDMCKKLIEKPINAIK